MGYGLAHNDTSSQLTGNKMYSNLKWIASPRDFALGRAKLNYSYRLFMLAQPFLLIVWNGLDIFVCLLLFVNFISGKDTETNFQGKKFWS